MLKLLGSLLLTAGTTAVGIRIAQQLGRRVRVLAQLCSAIQVMRGEILSRMCPVPELFDRLCKTMDEPVSLLFSRALKGMKNLGNRSFLRIWQEAIAKTPELMLSQEEQTALGELGYVLGQYGLSEQAAVLDYAQQRFAGFLQQAQEAKEKRGRLSIAFGAAAGLLLVILFT